MLVVTEWELKDCARKSFLPSRQEDSRITISVQKTPESFACTIKSIYYPHSLPLPHPLPSSLEEAFTPATDLITRWHLPPFSIGYFFSNEKAQFF